MVKDYIATYCRPQALPTRDGNVKIKDVNQLILRMILFIIARLVGSSTVHVARKSYMQIWERVSRDDIIQLERGCLGQFEETTY